MYVCTLFVSNSLDFFKVSSLAADKNIMIVHGSSGRSAAVDTPMALCSTNGCNDGSGNTLTNITQRMDVYTNQLQNLTWLIAITCTGCCHGLIMNHDSANQQTKTYLKGLLLMGVVLSCRKEQQLILI